MDCSFSAKIIRCLQAKVDKYTEEHSTPITLQQLIRVYKRGERTADFTFMPAKTTAQWAMARVNMFIRLAASQNVAQAYALHDQDILEGLDRSYEQEVADPFWAFAEGDFIGSRCDLLLAHVTDAEAAKLLNPPPN